VSVIDLYQLKNRILTYAVIQITIWRVMTGVLITTAIHLRNKIYEENIMKKSRLLCAVCACIFTLAISSVHAATLDQYFDIDKPTYFAYTLQGDFNHAQTFTVDISGYLTYDDIHLSKTEIDGFMTEPLFMDIRTTKTDGSPTDADSGSNILGKVSVKPDAVNLHNTTPPYGEFVRFDFSSLNIQVNTDDVLALVLSSESIYPSDGRYNWYGSEGVDTELDPPYTDGRFYGRSSGVDWMNTYLPEVDMAFKTYVSTVPIPAAVWLFGSGLLGLVGIARRKKTA
jgi:hypothetical protein